MKQIVLFLCRAFLSLTFAGLAFAGPAMAEAKLVKVALLLPGPISDGGWNQLAYDGLQGLDKSKYSISYIENVAIPKIPEVARGYADDGYDLIIGHGYEYGSAFLELAPDYPKTKFMASTFAPDPKIPGNLEYVDMRYLDAAYGAGALAALMSDSKKAVGFVGGGDNPTQQGMMKAFIAGATATVKGVKGLGVVTGDYNSATKGKEAALTMIGNGADVIWHAADVTGLGAIQGAASKGAKVIGCYSDQTSLAPDAMGTSFQLNLIGMVQTQAAAVADGSFKGGTEWKPTPDFIWLLKSGTNGDHNPKLIPAESWAAFQKIWADLGANKIDVAAMIK